MTRISFTFEISAGSLAREVRGDVEMEVFNGITISIDDECAALTICPLPPEAKAE